MESFWLYDLFIFKDSTFAAVKRDVKFISGYVKGATFVNGSYFIIGN